MKYTDDTRGMLQKIRNLMKEDISDSQDAIIVTDDPKFGQQILTNQENEFKSVVDSAADFNLEGDPNAPATNPLVYFPGEDGDLKFTGKVRNLYWQFSLKDTSGNGCYIYANAFQLSQENMAMLNKLQGYYENWKKYWETEGRLLDAFGKKNENL